jgi:hypothetical protein
MSLSTPARHVAFLRMPSAAVALLHVPSERFVVHRWHVGFRCWSWERSRGGDSIASTRQRGYVVANVVASVSRRQCQ